MVLVVSRRAQGVAGEVSGLLGKLVDGSLQVVELLSLAPFVSKVGISLVSLDAFQGVDEEGVLAPRQVLRRDSTAPPDGSIEVRSAVAIDEPHVYYAPRFAPLRDIMRPKMLSSSRSSSSSSKAASV
jgi:hypothetical protein